MKSVSLGIVMTLSLGAADSSAKVFEFGGYKFDDAQSANSIVLKGGGEQLGTLKMSSELPDHAPRSVLGFEGFGRDFNTALLFGNVLRAAAPVTLPRTRLAGEEGGLRSAISLRWIAKKDSQKTSKSMTNHPGVDLVFFEQGSVYGGPDAFMFRVHLKDGNWTPWYFKAPEKFQDVDGIDGYFITALDLDLLGIKAGEKIDEVQLSNMLPLDRLNRRVSLTTFGIVLPNFGGTRYARPATTMEGYRNYDAKHSFDPDLFFMAVSPERIP